MSSLYTDANIVMGAESADFFFDLDRRIFDKILYEVECGDIP
jgi:hypothetical protein